MRAPVELRRRPVVTAIVFAVTAATGLAQLVVPGMLAHLERTSAELHGEPWRMATALLVQDSGIVGGLSNLAFLAIVGAEAEHRVAELRERRDLAVARHLGSRGRLRRAWRSYEEQRQEDPKTAHERTP